MSELADKERRDIKILRMYRGDDPIEVSYSGGKDSDVILTLTKMAGIPYRAIYKNTTIDPLGTVQHCKDNWREYIFHDADGMIGFIGWEKDFRKAMKKK